MINVQIIGNAPIFEIYFGTNYSFGDGTATVTLPYTLKQREDPNNLRVYYLKDGMVAERINCTYNDGYITFVTNHFSTYAVVNEPAAENGMDLGLIVGGVVAGIVAILAAAVVIRRH